MPHEHNLLQPPHSQIEKLRTKAVHTCIEKKLGFLTANSSELNPDEKHLSVWRIPLPCGCPLPLLSLLGHWIL